MKIIKESKTTAGKRRITVELDDKEILVGVDPALHYRIGYPLEEVVPGHVLDVTPVYWCCLSQKWVD